MRCRQIWMVVTLLIYIHSSAFGKNSIDPLQHPVVLTVNANTCILAYDSDLGVLLK
jgi:hypothetical protein